MYLVNNTDSNMCGQVVNSKHILCRTEQSTVCEFKFTFFFIRTKVFVKNVSSSISH